MTDLSTLAASLSEAIGSVYCGCTYERIDGHCVEVVNRDDLVIFRDDLAGAIAKALRDHLERNG